jgi:hypothetical protein
MALTRLNNRALASDSQFTADQLDVGQLGGRRNLIINGDFQVAQRGTSFSDNSAQYMLDRWYGRTVGCSFSQQSNQYGRKSFSVFTKTSNDVDPFYNQAIEDGTSIAQGKTITVSYEYKLLSGSSDWFQSGAQVYVYTLDDATYRGGNFTSTDSLDNGWVRGTYTITIPENSTGHMRVGIEFNPTDGVTYSVAITNFQLEIGSVATPFEHRSYGEELALCQRYYYKSSGVLFGEVGFADSGTNAYVQHHHPVPMRASPSLSTSGTASDYALRVAGNTRTCNYVPALSSSDSLIAHALWRTSSGLVGGQALVGKLSTSSAYVAFDAEL